MKETRTLEYKSEVTNSFLKTVSAFSNFGTGKILFGVADDGAILGINDPEQKCLDIENKINDSISPKPDYALSINRLNNVITLEVNEGRYKPYFYKGKAYRRSDTASVEVDQIELKRLTLEGNNLYFESLANDAKDITFDELEKSLIDKLGVTEVNDDTLRTLGLYTKEGRLNNAASLLADKNDFSGIDVARFGNSIDEILDRESFIHMSVITQYDKALAMYRRYYQYEQIKGADRVLIEKVPEKAFREAVANALVHRTWDINANIRISMYDDRIEIASPGGLPSGISEDEYLHGNISTLRNPVLGNIFFRLHYIEMFGTGIKRIVDAYKDCPIKPRFEIKDNSITVTLPVLSATMSVTSDENKLIELLNREMRYSSSEIAEKLNWSKDKTVRNLNNLMDAGYVIKYGTGRGTKYSKK
ncbi:ATP-binding protein [[Clostridium] aminophilum]|uniref:ATP-dependent DNA helicase RecG n=1 Tax=[Clostridium] aminophilum TaxID=1526 RepID=A0A1I6KDE2_9FIRM|nr:ATP-binding protein [[Clostridium] aminophilum]SFR89048.1 ATP-dependent DNA helicase RecG [[Clostridium] aminophilum]